MSSVVSEEVFREFGNDVFHDVVAKDEEEVSPKLSALTLEHGDEFQAIMHVILLLFIRHLLPP